MYALLADAVEGLILRWCFCLTFFKLFFFFCFYPTEPTHSLYNTRDYEIMTIGFSYVIFLEHHFGFSLGDGDLDLLGLAGWMEVF